MYDALFSAGYNRAYERLPVRIQRKVDEQIRRLREDLHHPSLRAHKRRGEGGIWQARITRDYRLLFMKEGGTITLLHVGPHEK